MLFVWIWSFLTNFCGTIFFSPNIFRLFWWKTGQWSVWKNSISILLGLPTLRWVWYSYYKKCLSKFHSHINCIYTVSLLHEKLLALPRIFGDLSASVCQKKRSKSNILKITFIWVLYFQEKRNLMWSRIVSRWDTALHISLVAVCD